MRQKLHKLNELAAAREQTLSQMAIAWLLATPAVATVLTGASRPEQIVENVKALEHPDFTEAELASIEAVLAE